MKTVAVNKRTGSKSVYAEKTVHGRFYNVSTEKGFPQKWLVDEKEIRLIDPK